MNAPEARVHLKEAIDPILMAAMGLSAGAAGLVTRKLLKKLLTKRAFQQSDDDIPTRRATKTLHHMVRPIAKGLPYKTKGAHGWDVMVDAVMGDSQSTAAE